MEASYKRLLELRDMYGLSDTEFAKRIGVPKSSMSMYLSGKRKMRQDRVAVVANEFNVSEAWIMGYDAPMRKQDEEEHFKEHIKAHTYAEAPTLSNYYVDSESAIIAQELKNNPDLRILLDAAKNISPKELKALIAFVQAHSSEDE